MSISVIDDFASAEEVADLLDIYTSSHNQAEAERCLECNKPYYRFIPFEHDLFNKYAYVLNEQYNVDLRLSYSGLSIMACSSLPFHADNCKPEDDTILGTPDSEGTGLVDIDGLKWMPNHCHTRTMTAVLYLNTIACNGATVFPQHNIKVFPKKGSLLTFPCDHDYIHGVSPVGPNIRIAALLWFVNR